MDVSVWFMYLDRRSTAVKPIYHNHLRQKAATYVRRQGVSFPGVPLDASVWFMYLDHHDYLRQEAVTLDARVFLYGFHVPLCLRQTLGPGMDASVWFMYLDRR